MKCPRCQHGNPQGARFCEECAAPLARTCPNCSTPLSATARFCHECAQPLGAGEGTQARFASPETYTPKHLAERILTSKAALEGERKQVTVLFADLKGSMELLADRDPEEARKLLDPVLEHMMEAVHRYEGTVNQVMGDGIMALFGAPVAHEDHAVRACYAALRMQQAVQRYGDGVFRTYGVPIRIRVGLNSGEVVVRAIGSDLHMDYTAVGQTTHLAARMEQMANPGTILMTADTLHLSEGFVQIQPLGATPVKGLAGPVEIFELTGASAVRSRLQAAAARGLTSFVGRDTEMDTLFAALEQAKAGKGQVVAVVGEPGVGKSRLYWEFTHSHRTQGCLVLEAASVSYGKATTYLPVIDLIKGYFQIEPRDDTRKIREKVTGKLFSLDRALEGCLAPLLWLLDVGAEDPDWERLDPPMRRQRLLESLRRLILRESHVQPLVLMFEDLHWIDGETQALLDSLMESLPTARLLLLVNYRPEYRHAWGSKTYYRQLRIDPLSSASAGQLLGGLLGGDPSVVALRPVLIARTEGNPFFLEESVRSLIETGALAGERGAYQLVKAIDTLQIPATTQTILAARIDRLSPEDKSLLQTASVIGKDVPYPLLQAVAEMDEPTLRAGLTRLQAAEFLYAVQLFPEAQYTFKHALTHEVAYATLLADRRRRLHVRTVDAIEHIYAERLDEQLERLAQHASRGDIWDKALTYLRDAATKAQLRCAHAAAVGFLEDALRVLAHLPSDERRMRDAVQLRLQLHASLFPLAEFQRLNECLRGARDLAQQLGDRPLQALASARTAHSLWATGEQRHAIEEGEHALLLATGLEDQTVEILTSHYLGQALQASGEYRRSTEHLLHGIRTIGDARAQERFGRAGLPAVFERAWLAWSLAELGEFAEAARWADEALTLAESSEQLYTLFHAFWGRGMVHLIRGEIPEALRTMGRAHSVAESAGLTFMLAFSSASLGCALALSGNIEEAEPLLEHAVHVGESRGVAASYAEWLVLLGEVRLGRGRVDDARAFGERALQRSREKQERATTARALRLLADIAASDAVGAEAATRTYGEAAAVAAELGMRPLVAHCHLGLGKTYRRTGEGARAREHLTTATTMYREMGMRLWLERAEAEMAEMKECT
jgi:class 3 adenylate cyclase/tetratricopeptide (TPR) repeat protein